MSFTPTSQVFKIRKSSNDSKLFLVRPAGSSKHAPPLYSIAFKSKKPNLLVYRGHTNLQNPVGYATFHTFSSTIDMSLGGHHIPLKESTFATKHSFQVPNMGRFQWKYSLLSGSHQLYDASGQKIAKLSSVTLSLRGERKLELMVQCNGFFMDLVVMSAMATEHASGKAAEASEASAEVVSAVVGITT
ncbi:hypothetical protein G7Z17_g10581 [Cylindrodendrum hubeiense]|uniref:DUF6593 domain-containing protein n=1 Tax=Cylindrodendrum hubeiense TaxID=595255 RepID=A0A9P5GYJ3_9HYPO|nr:hypothetical protein G7Z17_g10581 [Cylindrodendrum hubeiense]